MHTDENVLFPRYLPADQSKVILIVLAVVVERERKFPICRWYSRTGKPTNGGDVHNGVQTHNGEVNGDPEVPAPIRVNATGGTDQSASVHGKTQPMGTVSPECFFEGTLQSVEVATSRFVVWTYYLYFIMQ